MPVQISSTAPVNGYFPDDEPAFDGTRAAFLASKFVADVPDASAAGGYVSQHLTPKNFLDILFANWNAQPNPYKVVATYADLLALPPLSCCVGTKGVAQADTPNYPAGDYVLLYTDHSQAWNYVCKDGRFDQNPSNLTDAAWYPVDSPEAGAPDWASFQPDPQNPVATYAFTDGQFVRTLIPGETQVSFFSAIGDGVWAVPSAVGGDARWLAVDRNTVPTPANTVLFQRTTQAQSINQLDNEAVVPGRLYGVTIGSTEVWVQGLDNATLSSNGEVLDPNNSQRTLPVLVDVRSGSIQYLFANYLRLIGDPANNNIVIGPLNAGNDITSGVNNLIVGGSGVLISHSVNASAYDAQDSSIDGPPTAGDETSSNRLRGVNDCHISGTGGGNSITDSDSCTLIDCTNVQLIGCSGFSPPTGTSNKTYIHNVEAGTGGPVRDIYAITDAKKAQVIALFSGTDFSHADVLLSGDTHGSYIGTRFPDKANGDFYECAPDTTVPDGSGNATPTWFRY